VRLRAKFHDGARAPLFAANLEAAWEYAAAKLAEIDRAIRENEEGAAGFVE